MTPEPTRRTPTFEGATGHGPEPLREGNLNLVGAARMVRRNFLVFARTLHLNFLPPIVEPILYLLALGYGLGMLINEVAGVPYAQFIAPGLIAITVMQTAFFETTYSSFVRMFFQKTWDALLATPLSHADIMTGEVLWAGLRSTINATLMTLVVFAFGLVESWYVLLVPFIALLGGLTFGAIGLMLTSKVKAIDQFSYAMYLFVTPMFLFAGTFFPLSQLPAFAKYLALALPLTHIVNVMRWAVTGIESGYELLGGVYLIVAVLVLVPLSVRMAERRVRG